MILAGDIGGTNTRLAFFDIKGSRLQRLVEQVYPSHDHRNLEEIVRAFVSTHPQPVEHACFGIAGPVRHGRCEATNLPWVVESRRLAQEVGLETVGLINDLEANAYGIATLEPQDFLVLNDGDPQAQGNIAVIAAGTGLGEAALFWDGQRHWPYACEGGHTGFAPSNALQVELLTYLMGQLDHVSWERVLCGPGLYTLYKFFRDTGRGEEPAWLTEALQQGDPVAAVSRAGLAGTCELCVQALDLFVSLYGIEAGDLALKVMATGGVFLGGGIAPRLVEKLKGPTFMQAFTAKGRMRSLLEAMPVRVILNDKTALQGSARHAALQAGRL
jgi:glucokinase